MRAKIVNISTEITGNNKEYKKMKVEFKSGKTYIYSIFNNSLIQGLNVGDYIEYETEKNSRGFDNIKSIKKVSGFGETQTQATALAINYKEEMDKAISDTIDIASKYEADIQLDWTKIALSLFIARTRK